MKKLKVLIVDDIASMRKFARFNLEKSFPGINVDEAAGGKEAQTKIELTGYDLILCDWEMPDITGDEVLRWVRQHPTMSATPFMMVTSRNDKHSVMRAVEAGANSYVVKPYTAEMLMQKITAVIDKFDRRRHERFAVGGSVTARFRDAVTKGAIIDLSLGGLFCSITRSNPIPGIFEKTLLDISLDDDREIKGIEAFVIRIQAAEAFIDAEEIRLAFKFLQLTDIEQGALKQLLNSPVE